MLEFVARITRSIAWRIKWTRKFLLFPRFALKALPSEIKSLSASSPNLSTEFIGNSSQIAISIISNRPWLARRVQSHLQPLNAKVVDGQHVRSFSELCNSILRSDPDKIHVFVGDKCFPSATEIVAIVNKLNEGFVLVGGYKFGCFAVSPYLIKYVGFFDEGFVGGQYEDIDMIYRIHEANLAMFMTESVSYFPLPSSWDSTISKAYFDSKWLVEDKKFPVRLRPNDPSCQTVDLHLPNLTLKNWSSSRLIESNSKSAFEPWFRLPS